MKYMGLIIFFFASTALANGRFFYEGNGSISVENVHNKKTFKGRYRDANGNYDPVAISKLNRVFNIPEDYGEDFSLRTLSFIDFLEDKYALGKTLKLNSTYRSPEYNMEQPGTAQTSYHTFAMAADIVFPPDVDIKELSGYAKSLHYGGVGYYKVGNFVHIDSGYPRYWFKTEFEDTSGTEDKTPQKNKNIYLSVDKDIYFPGETIHIFLSGVSQYPFHISSKMSVHGEDGKGMPFVGSWPKEIKDECVEILGPPGTKQTTTFDRSMIRQIAWKIPSDFVHLNKKLMIQMSFCNTPEEKDSYPDMPEHIDSRAFEVHPL